jgi:hypothetical protein
MNKLSRHQPVVQRQSESDDNGDHWLKEFENKLVKTSVQPIQRSLFDQISSIMNGSSKYSSVQEKVNDMLERSGMKAYIDGVKAAEQNKQDNKKVAQQIPAPKQTTPAAADDNNAKKSDKDGKQVTVLVFQQKPTIANTLRNIIESSRGNLPIPTIIDKLHSLHQKDIADDNDWDDDNLIREVSRLNLEAKCNNPSSYEDDHDLGRADSSTADSDIDASNTDAFHALDTARM